MARNLLQDMVRVKNNNPRPLETKKETKREIKAAHPIHEVRRERERIEIPDEIKNKKSKYRLFFVAIISIVVLLFALSFLFSGARVIILPKVKEIPLNENFSAYKDGSPSDLSYDLVVISGEESKNISGAEEKDVAVKATGTVIFFNSFSTSSQNLDIDTRLEGSNGKIYKTSKKITIPGVKKDGNPGTVEVSIYGSLPGAEYNSSALDFKILGFKGTSKYAKIFAKSKSGKDGEIKGGFVGKMPVVSDLEKASTVNELKSNLESKLLKKTTEQIPSGFILFKDATFLSMNDQDVTYKTGKDNETIVNIKGTLYGFLFDEKKLTKKIAENIIDKYNGEDIYIPNIRDLKFSLSDKDNISFADVKNISFSLSGDSKVIWRVDEKKFVSDLLNKKKKNFNEILLKYPNIDSAELVLRPFWKATFPENTKSIETIVKYPNN